MKKINLIIDFLFENPEKSFSDREIAEHLIRTNERIRNRLPNYGTEKKLLNQVSKEMASEIFRYIENAKKHNQQVKIFVDREQKPKRSRAISPQASNTDQAETKESVLQHTTSNTEKTKYSEHDLYPILINWLSSEQDIKCRRINENKSSNSRGAGGNFWRHPDIVGIEDVSVGWSSDVIGCARNGNFSPIRWSSYEVKIELSLSNVRESFFQALSNSSWANEGYLVTSKISESRKKFVINELRELSDDYGIGVIILNVEDFKKSEIIFQAQRKEDVNWRAVERIYSENSDFQDYVERVNDYYKTGKFRNIDWNK